jgi:endoglucanase
MLIRPVSVLMLAGMASLFSADVASPARSAVPQGVAADPGEGRPFDAIEALVLTDQIIMVSIVEGHVIHHQRGQKRGESHVELTQLDTTAAMKPDSWSVRSEGDTRFAKGLTPEHVYRKSKGIDFAWMVQGWDQVNNRTKNTDPDHAKQHWIYLRLPMAMTAGKTYVIDGSAVPHVGTLTLTYDPQVSRSEAVHVNVLGYVPDVSKFAYVYHWGGDLGSLDLSGLKGKSFSLIDQKTKKAVFTSDVHYRAPADQVETIQHDTPKQNYINAEVWDCDFTAFTTPGSYVVSVEGVGCSFPFTIAADVYREAFVTTTRGLYHNRSGIALTKPYTEYERPAPANPLVTPGFAGKLVYTSSRCTSWSNGDHSEKDKPAVEAGIKGPIDVWGWYQDAGDWDGYTAHLNVATTLLFTYEMAPKNFSDGELNIPESGNKVPDIIDEAAWLPRFCHRLRHAMLDKGYGTGGIGLRVCGDFFGGDEKKDGTTQGSWEDTRQYIVSGEDQVSTFRYAGAAAHLAYALQLAGVKDPEGIDWMAEAKASYDWAMANNFKEHEKEVATNRRYAAAALFRMTGDKAYEEQFAKDCAEWKMGSELWWEDPYGAWVYCLGNSATDAKRDTELLARMRAIVLKSCEIRAIDVPAKRALRWGGGWDMPMLVGQQTTPWIMDGMIGYSLLRTEDPAKAQLFRNGVATTADYFLGTNALNMTWVTGLGVRHVNQVFHMDAWYNGKSEPHPGIVPYGPWRGDDGPGQGPWDAKWPNSSVYPAISEWPGNERWFDNRNCPLGSEFTIHQTTCWSAATYGWLCGTKSGK